MKLPFPAYFSQKDARWGNKKLGTSTVSLIKDYGCLLCDVCSVLNYYGKEITPDLLNDNLVRVKGFVNGSFLVYGAVSDIYPDVTVDWGNYIDCSSVEAPLDKIDQILFSKKPVIVKVDYDKSTTKLDEHWVTIIGKTEDGSYLIYDPIDGTEQFFQARYGDPKRYIFKIVVYNGTPKVTTTVEDKLRDLEDKVNSLNKTVAELSLENNQLRTDLSLQEKENNDLVKQASEARGAKDASVWEAQQSEIKAKTSQEALNLLQVRYDALSVDYKKLQDASINGLSGFHLIALGIKKLLTR
jgi:regulator of replication initiation timing